MTASSRWQFSAAIAEPATTRATVRPRAASQPGASAKSAPTAVQPRSRSNEVTGCARADYLNGDDSEVLPGTLDHDRRPGGRSQLGKASCQGTL